MKGFYIKKLRVFGETKNSEVEFELGLNVVTGPSNTGKSFLFECIDYMFGKKELKEIEELEGYEYILLEITTFENSSFTLKRKLNSNDIFVCEGQLSEWSDVKADKKNAKHSDKDNNISHFLLNLMGISTPVDILKNQSGDKQSLTFRSLSEWFIIDENSMISNVKLLLGEFVFVTPMQSTFLYVVDGFTYDLKNKKESSEIAKAKLSAKIDLTELNLSNNKKRQAELTKLLEKKSFDLNEDNLKKYKQELSELQNKINESNQKVMDLRKDREKVNNSIYIKNQQISKFEKLKKQYNNDIERLSFIKDNSVKLLQLESHLCPLCGNELTKELDEEVINSCAAETENIAINLTELEGLSSEIIEEKSELENKLSTLNKSIFETNCCITENYEKIKPLKISVDEYINQKQVEIELQNLEKLEKLIFDDVLLKKEEYKSVKTDKFLPAMYPPSENRKQFEKFLEQTFKCFDKSIQSVKLTSDLLDIEINGKHRTNNGKGYRAFYKSLYFYALALFKIIDDNYTKFLILDSPLTTFREENGYDDSEEISTNLQYKFIEELASQKNIQIIVFENKEMPDDLKNSINLITFTKNDKTGRYGFLE